MTEKITIKISKDLYEKADKFIKEQGGFTSVEELIEFLLQEILTTEETEGGMSKEDEEKVKERLRALGYL